MLRTREINRTEPVDRIEVRSCKATEPHETDVLPHGLGDLATGVHLHGVGVEDDLEHGAWVIRGPAVGLRELVFDEGRGK